MAKSSKMADLMGIIAQAPTAMPASKAVPKKTTQVPRPVKKSKRAPRADAASASGAAGRFSSIYLNPEDQKTLREFSVWFAGQGKRINDTLIIRAALRAAKTGSALLAAYEEAAASDRRFKKK